MKLDPNPPLQVSDSQSLDWYLQFDEDTGFLRRTVFQQSLELRLQAASSSCSRVLLFELVIAHMHDWVEALGNNVRESVMANVASRFRGIEQEGWLIGRASEDGLLLATPPFGDEPTEERFISQLQVLTSHSVRALSLQIPLSVKIGVASYPADALSAKHLMDNARLAMIHCEMAGGYPEGAPQFSFYLPAMGLSAQREGRLLLDLPKAFDRHQVSIRFSPELSLKSGEVMCVNCQPVWIHPELGEVCVEELYSLARRSALAASTGESVLSLALQAWCQIQNTLQLACQFSVAMPLEWVRYPDLRTRLATQLQKQSIHPRDLIVAFQEKEFHAHDRMLALQLNGLTAEGYRFALEGFGLGQASLTTLRHFPIHKIRIASELIESVAMKPEDFNFSSAIVSMAKSLHIQTLAGGVKYGAQLSVLARLGCDLVQGSLHLDHANASEFVQWFERHLPLTSVVNAQPCVVDNQVILLVDDEPNMLSALKRLLRRDGYVIHTANSAREAFDILAQERVDVIVSDQRMPEMSGTEFLSQVKDLYPETVRLVLSGYTEVGSVTEAINKGAIYKFLTKPWDDEQLRANIREAFLRHDMAFQNTKLKREVEEINSELVQLNHILEQRVLDRNERIARDNDFRLVMQEILDALPVGVLGVDLTGDVVSVNRTACDILGLPSGALIGRSVDHLPSEIAELIESFLMEFEPHSRWMKIPWQNKKLSVQLTPMGLKSKSNGCLVALDVMEST